MTLNQLQEKFVSIIFSGYGHHKVTFIVRGKEKSVITTNTPAIDRINFRDNYNDRHRHSFYTLKEAYQALWNEVTR